MSALGEYAQKAIAAGSTVLKLRAFLKSKDQELTLSREEVEAIMMAFREFSAKMKAMEKQ